MAQQKHAVVVGAGPAGALTALLLAEQGFRVSVYEKRQPEQGSLAAPAPSGAAPAGSAAAPVLSSSATLGLRSYNVVLSERAMRALDRARVALPIELAPAYHAAVMHKVQGGAANDARVMPRKGSDVVVNRGVLASALVRACQERYPEAIHFHFGQALSGLDGQAWTARFVNAENEPEEVAFDLLVGADGANSRTRALLAQQDPGFTFEQRTTPTDYKAFSLGPVERFMPASLAAKGGVGTVHAWVHRKRGDQIVSACSADAQLLAVLILKRGEHERLGDAAGYEGYLQDRFPSIPLDVVASAAEQLAAAPASVGGISTRCSKLSSGRVVLVGDAAHSVWPTLGHGANGALEGADVLASALEKAGGTAASPGQLEAALEAYSAQRLPDGLAVVQLSEEGFSRPLFFPQLLTQSLLRKALPWLVPPPAFTLLHGSALPYSTIQRRMRREALTFRAGLAAVGLAAVALVAGRVSRRA